MSRTHIAIGIICDSSTDAVLVCLRPPDSAQGGKWEFPGGKVEQDETVFQALRRELGEETGIFTESAHSLIQVDYDYSEGGVRLHVWMIDHWSGSIEAKEGQIVRWVPRSDLNDMVMPPANAPIIKALQFPPLYLITPDLQFYDDGFLQMVQKLVCNGLRLLQFRSRQSTFRQHGELVRDLVQICNNHACKLIYNGDIDNAVKVDAHGVHLRSDDLMQTKQRSLGPEYILSASCHNIEQINHANAIGSDICIVGSVHQTSTHPDMQGIGWNGFRDIANAAMMPVYAIGGVQPDELSTANLNGAHGIAMISGIWAAADPVTAIRSLVPNV